MYLNAKGHIKRIIFDPNYYIQKVFPYHHDRSVQEDEYMEILQKLKFFPEVQRLIFLNLWATGLRISEVCTLKGGAYYWDGEDAWIKVYQIKMKTEKMIPISLVLYQIMKIYIKSIILNLPISCLNQRMAGHIGLVPLLRASKQIVRSMEYIFRAKHSRRMITGIHWQVVSMMKECPFRRFGII